MNAADRAKICQLIDTFRLDEAEASLREIAERTTFDDDVCFLLGNIYRKHNDWKEALQWYAKSIEQNPEGPALHAREMLNQIIEFYDKERYNV